MIRAYMACVSFADDRIGMILDALDKSAYADNTVIVLVGDNGYHHGEKDRWAKSALWREACHVPLIIAGPRTDKRLAKGTCNAAVSSIDIYPTLVDVCQLPKVENQLAGNSLMPLLSDVGLKWDKPSITSFLPGNFTVHAGKWNFIRYADGSRELYNITEDEHEFTNLAGKAEFKAAADSLASFMPAAWHPGIAQTLDAKPARRRMNAAPGNNPARNPRSRK
jgi:arylsulfatase A-like enzyme